MGAVIYMEEKTNFRLRPLRIINYLILLGLELFLYSVLKSYFLLLFAVVMLTCPVISLIGIFYMGKGLSLELGIGKNTLVCKEEVLVELRLKNPAWFPALQSRISFFVSNTFLENRMEWTLEMPVKMHGESVLKLPLRFVELGRFSMECDMLSVQDIMGFIIIKIPLLVSGEIYVLPDKDAEALPDVTAFMAGAAEVEESKHKGSDFSEVSDIREYIPGDRIRDIHWKISARYDELMVKERVATAGSEMVLLPDLVKDDEAAQQILRLCFGLGLGFMKQRLPVCILCWNSRDFCFEQYRCASEAELVKAYSEIYRQPLSVRINGNRAAALSNFFPYLKSYILVGISDGAVRAGLREN